LQANADGLPVCVARHHKKLKLLRRGRKHPIFKGCFDFPVPFNFPAQLPKRTRRPPHPTE
jgi:hypothetical protein